MPEVPIPFTQQSVDTDDDPSMILMTVVLGVVGFGLFAMFQQAGNTLYQKANQTFASVTGVQLSGGEDSSPEVV